MTHLVVCVSTGKGTWNYINELISSCEWESVFVITNEFGSQKFRCNRDVNIVKVDFEKEIPEIVNGIVKEMDGKVADTEIALNLVSGTGKEHMAILSAMLRLGLGVRLVDSSGGKMREI